MFKGQAGNKHIKYISLGIEIAAGLSFPILLGFWLDTRWDTMPWLTLLGVLLGIGSFASTIVRVNRSLEKDDRETK